MLKILQEISHQFWTSYKLELPSLNSFSNQVSSQQVLHRIDHIVFEIIKQILTGEKVTLTYLKPSLSCQYDPSTGINRLKDPKFGQVALSQSSLKTFARYLMIFTIVQRLLKTGQKATKREIYYREPSLFSTQNKSDRAIETISLILEVPRSRLNILSAGTGLVSGNLQFHENGIEVNIGNRVSNIPNDVDNVSYISTAADFILVVEKDTVLSRLVEERFFESTNCIGITGCGYPDCSTREFLRRLVEEFTRIPVLVLTDFDPHGFHILCTYTFGSDAKSAECDSLAVPTAHWLGLHFGDTCEGALALGDKDRALIQKMLRFSQFGSLPANYQSRRFGLWREALFHMAESGCKYEIESLLSSGRLSDYILGKIERGAWL